MTIKFSRATFNEQVATRLVAASPDAVTPGMATAAAEFLIAKQRELHLNEPKTDTYEIYNRVIRAFPDSARLVATPYLRGYAAEVEGVEEEEAA